MGRSDKLTESGALELRRVILKFWNQRGFFPEVRVTKQNPSNFRDDPDCSFGVWAVRSNLVDGLPKNMPNGVKL